MAGKNQQLQRLLEQYEGAVQTLRAAIALLNSGAPAGSYGWNGNGNGLTRAGQVKQAQRTYTVRQAIKADNERLNVLESATHAAAVRKGYRPNAKKWTHRIQKQRALSAAFLAEFDRDDPRRPIDLPAKFQNGQARGLGSLVRRGYLKRKAAGYVRTEKPFSIDRTTAQGE